MRNLLRRAKAGIIGLLPAISAVTTGAKLTFSNNRGEGFVDTAIKILMAVVIGALLLAGLYALFGQTVLPTLVQRIQDMFNFTG